MITLRLSEESDATINLDDSTDKALAMSVEQYIASGANQIKYGTTAYWSEQTDLVAEEGIVYIYSDYYTVDDVPVAGIKVGDGTSYLIDMPFITSQYDLHIANSSIHVSATDRENWDNKNRAYVESDNLILTTQ